jgi:general secretion pathway protein B
VSYILDALKKSEQQRPPGNVPDLFTVHGPQPPSPRRSARAIVAVALMLAVSAIALWRWIERGARNEDAARSPAATSPQPRAAAEAEAEVPRTAAEPTPTARTPAAVGVATRRPVGERAETPPSSARKAGGSVAAPTLPTATPAALPAPAVPAPASVPAAAIATPPAPIMSTPAPLATPPAPAAAAPAPVTSSADVPPLSEPEPKPAPAEDTPPADGRVVDLAELPVPVRAQLPKLLVSGHVWSEEPSLRLLGVDDRLLREGAEAAPGLSLREITPAGAVFVFRGWHFRVPGGRP